MLLRLVRSTLWAALWAIVVAASVTFHLTSIGWAFDKALLPALFPYLAGAFTGSLFGHAMASRLPASKQPTVHFAAFFAATAIMTLGFTAFFFYIQQRAYFAQWHAEIFTIRWFLQAVFTGFGSAYLFLATGLRPLLPWAVVALALASLSFSRGRFPASR